MIFLTGDCHGEFARFARKRRKCLSFQLATSDYVIICGDFGLCWAEDEEYAYNCRWLSALPFTILWVQGNHENYDMLGKFPLEEWCGGKVRHIVRDKIILLERGQIFEIEGKIFFTFGGGSTHDVEGRILNRESPFFMRDRKRLKRERLTYRIKGETWWEQELPRREELEEAKKNLVANEFHVDYCISHCASNRMQRLLVEKGKLSPEIHYEEDVLTNFFEELEEQLQFKHWYFGHYHVEEKLDGKHTALYEGIVPLLEENNFSM